MEVAKRSRDCGFAFVSATDTFHDRCREYDREIFQPSAKHLGSILNTRNMAGTEFRDQYRIISRGRVDMIVTYILADSISVSKN